MESLLLAVILGCIKAASLQKIQVTKKIIKREISIMLDRLFWVKFALKFSLILFLLVALQDGFSHQIDTLLRSENPFRNTSVFILVWSLSFIAVFLSSLVHINVVRLYWSIWFAISIFAFLTFKAILGYAPTLGDAKILWIETGQANAAFIFYWTEALFPLIVSLVFFWVSYLPIRPIPIFSKRVVALLVSILPFIPIAMITGMLVIKGGGAGVGIPSGFYAASSFMASIFVEENRQTTIDRDDVPYLPSDSRIKNVVLVVDESISGDFISLDPERSITSALVNNKNKIIDFGQVSSGHNCSSFSNAILRWGIAPGNLDKAEKLPTIWQYAKLSGYETTYIDSQKQPGTYSNFMSIDEAKEIDNFIQFKSPQIERDIQYISNDFEAAKIVSKLIQNDQKNFIYINKLGAHVPFEGKYPKKYADFTPHMELFESVTNTTRERMINSYKNAISWNVNNFFNELMRDGLLSDTVIIYTSDHGQNLLEGGVATHCSRSSKSAYEALVPLLMVTENEAVYEIFDNVSKINQDKVSHFNIFPTMIGLMGYPINQVEKDYFSSLFVPVERLGKYASGDLFTINSNNRSFNWKDFNEVLDSRM